MLNYLVIVCVCCGLLGAAIGIDRNNYNNRNDHNNYNNNATTSKHLWNWSIKPNTLQTRWANSVRTAMQTIRKPLPEYPRPQFVRKSWLNLNGIWTVSSNNSNDGIYKEKILVPFAIESTLSGIGKNISVDSKLIYERTFLIPKRWRDQIILLHFGAVDWFARVFVNDMLVGEHYGGYDSFTIDITDSLTSATSKLSMQKSPLKRQKLRVEVMDPTDQGYQPRGKQVRHPHKIWYTSVTGIWATVWLEMVPREVSIRRLKILPLFDDAKVEFEVNLQCGRSSSTQLVSKAEYSLHVDVFSTQASVLYNIDKHFSCEDSQLVTGTVVRATLVMPVDFIPWSPSIPHLYDVRMTIANSSISNQSNSIILDEITSYFGMRKISLGKPLAKGFVTIQLNNQPYFQMGLLDQGWWPDGLYTAPSDEALKYDIAISKKLGFNMIRKHVKVEPDRWYYWCDVLGILVWQDLPSGDAETARYIGPDIVRSADSKAHFYEEWANIMGQLINHPSIVTWVPFNEGWGQFDTALVTSFTKQHDASRIVDAVSGWIDRQTGDIIDVHNYPKPIAPRPESERASVLGEYGGLGLYIPGHSWTSQPSWSYKKITNSSDLTEAFLHLLVQVKELRDKQGLCAAIYTQTTDVEGEVNGVMTYDREVVKLEVNKIHLALQSLTGVY